MAASSERREKGRNWVSQAVSSSGGVKKSEEEDEGVGVEEANDDESPSSPASSSSAAALAINKGLSALGTRTIDKGESVRTALRCAGTRTGRATAEAAR